jgi:hypothetical protein
MHGEVVRPLQAEVLVAAAPRGVVAVEHDRPVDADLFSTVIFPIT